MDTVMCRGLGCIEEEFGSVGDTSLEQLVGAGVYGVPATLDKSDILPPRTNQGGTASCVGHALANAITYVLRRSHGVADERPSPLIIYDMARGMRGLRGRDIGCRVSDAVYSVRDFGFAPESACPWDPARVLQHLDAGEYLAAIVQSGMRCHRLVDKSEATIKGVLASGCGVLAGLAVDKPFTSWSKPFWPGTSDIPIGYHAQAIWDYPDGLPRMIGSYGTAFADSGMVTTSWEVIAGGDVWVVDVAPEYAT